VKRIEDAQQSMRRRIEHALRSEAHSGSHEDGAMAVKWTSAPSAIGSAVCPGSTTVMAAPAFWTAVRVATTSLSAARFGSMSRPLSTYCATGTWLTRSATPPRTVSAMPGQVRPRAP
jgi:hypothetical protein